VVLRVENNIDLPFCIPTADRDFGGKGDFANSTINHAAGSDFPLGSPVSRRPPPQQRDCVASAHLCAAWSVKVDERLPRCSKKNQTYSQGCIGLFIDGHERRSVGGSRSGGFRSDFCVALGPSS